jgi:hypothetical protein
MIKTHYLQELSISAPQSVASHNNADTLKIQAWLSLFALVNPSAGTSTAIDGAFGPATVMAVNNFLKAKNLPQTGTVDATAFKALSESLSKAFQTQAPGANLRELIVNTAHQHLDNHAFELVINKQNNCGPWVRSYMDGLEGESWYWCMGFVQTILDQSASRLGKDYRTVMPASYSCDIVGAAGVHKGFLRKNSEVISNPSIVKPGDVFLVQKALNDWEHTGIITAIHDDVFETIEGNTNNDGSSNGNGVYKRIRNFKKSKLDVFSIQALV